MFLAEGKEIHQNTEVHELWNKWHQTQDPIERLCLLIKEGEEEAGIQALVGRVAPKAKLAKKITISFSYSTNLYTCTYPKNSTLKHVKISLKWFKNTHSLGIYISSNWIERWFLCFISSHHLNTPIILSGPKDFAELICKATYLIFNDISFESIKLSRRRGHLWGKNNKEHDIFELSPLSIAIRNTIQKNVEHPRSLFYHISFFADDISRHLKDDTLYSSLESAYSDQGVSLIRKNEIHNGFGISGFVFQRRSRCSFIRETRISSGFI